MFKLSNNQECNIIFWVQIASYLSIPIFLINSNTWQLLTGILLSIAFYTIGIGMTYHRFITHQSFKLNPTLEKIFTLFGVLATQGSPVAWAALHRAHHKYSDTDLDSHSPLQGKIKSWFFAMYPNKDVSYIRFSAKLLKHPFYKLVHENYFKIILLYIITIILFFGPFAVVYGYLFPVAWGWVSIGSINVICHHFGYRNTETKDLSTNNNWLLLIAHGEHLHNNHHADQSNDNFAKNKGEFDPINLIIKGLRKVNLAK